MLLGKQDLHTLRVNIVFPCCRFVSIWDMVSIFTNRFLDVSENACVCFCVCVNVCPRVSGSLGMFGCVSLVVCMCAPPGLCFGPCGNLFSCILGTCVCD